MEATPTQIINYFSGFKQNLVPLFQRPYTWGERQWRTLWDDILMFYGSAEHDLKSTHFMGAVVTMPARSVPVGVSKFMVIDGQQRLTTIAILLCAIRDGLSPAEDIPKRRIQNHYLTNDGYEGLEVFKLLPTQGDRAAYSPMIQSSPLPPGSHFKKAYDFFQRRLKDRDDDDNPLDVKKILEIIETRLMVVMINLSDSDDPYLIFESLNFKGSPLEQSDLVRNYFLMRFPVSEQQAIYDELWLPMQTRLGPNLTEFMRHYLGSEGEEVRKGDVYAAIKRLVSDSDPAAVRVLMTRMAELAVFYSRIATLAAEAEESFGKFFILFHRLDFGTAYPLLLSLYEDYADGQFGSDEFVSCLRLLDSYIVRRMVVGVPSNSLSGTFIGLCKNRPVTETPSAWLSAALARESKNRRWPTDREFMDCWVRSAIYPRRVCQIVLERIEEQFGHHESVSVGESTIEHILPQTLSPEWEQLLGENASQVQAEWLHTIGNLTLTGYNPELGNQSFAEKRKIFAQSHFELNRYFANLNTWGTGQILQRSQDLFKTALGLWPRPVSLPEEESAAEPRTQPANFHAECVRAAQEKLGAAFSKLSQTRYEAGDEGMRLVCAVSTEHKESSDTPYFWFALHLKQLEFLTAAPTSWLCYGCGSAERTLLLPTQVIRPHLDQMSASSGSGRHYWHIVIQRKEDRFVLRLLGALDGPDLTSFLVSAAVAASSS
jgi:uncharacterized protein with ParB-like and HNH nuclease domain